MARFWDKSLNFRQARRLDSWGVKWPLITAMWSKEGLKFGTLAALISGPFFGHLLPEMPRKATKSKYPDFEKNSTISRLARRLDFGGLKWPFVASACPQADPQAGPSRGTPFWAIFRPFVTDKCPRKRPKGNSPILKKTNEVLV